MARAQPRLRTIEGPSALATGRGRRRHSLMNARYFGFAGLFCGMAVPRSSEILVMQRLRLEAPVLLEVERSRVALGPPVIEDAQAALDGPPHQVPVLEVVGSEGARAAHCPRRSTAGLRRGK